MHSFPFTLTLPPSIKIILTHKFLPLDDVQLLKHAHSFFIQTQYSNWGVVHSILSYVIASETEESQGLQTFSRKTKNPGLKAPGP
jgi:hypothetical protein